MAGPHPAVAAVRGAVAAALADLPDGARVLVACSGGPDSLALAAGAAFVAASRARRGAPGPRVGAVVVDHGLQPGSADVAGRAARDCRALGLDPVEVVAVDATGPGGPEAAARDARYAALDAAAVRHGAAAVLLGHTRDDQAEGVLLGLARGSGARSLAGMPAVRGVLRRPLLGLSRAETVAACAALGLDPWHDPTNTPAVGDAGAPARSRVRARVLPVLEEELGPGVAAALARSADLLREDADALDALAADLLARAVAAARAPAPTGPADARDPVGAAADAAPGPVVLLDTGVLAAAPAALRHRALRAAAVRAGAPAGSVTRAHVAAVAALVTDWRGQGPVHLPGRVAASRACGRLALRAASPSTDPGDVVRAGPGARRAVEPDDEGDPQR
ncbi:tRNA lysidine(34) synthetase TilS [Cellulomonas sp. ACRRI]|uniref:tRNA lysidine(34) synthetase TilS n=1 Tax=Cellulomonas sp. ACRRI TaxID=2918188 RepID=UPI001EF2DD70|nr:tRNA lysidine(34) synthetase TilS [Cellulomonas sp. ACRRI]MCG7287418.1 tRNA lysidine(34) synthetase TilS [Cellulomonas sp. ACRRI]